MATIRNLNKPVICDETINADMLPNAVQRSARPRAIAGDVIAGGAFYTKKGGCPA